MEERNPIVYYCGDFRKGDLFEIPCDFEGDLVVEGNLRVDVDVNFKGGLFVLGNLFVAGTLEAEHVFSAGYIEAEEIRAQDIICKGIVLCENLAVAGDFECKVIEAGNIYVASSVSVQKNILMHGKALEVGKDLRCRGIVGNPKVTVGGKNYCE